MPTIDTAVADHSEGQTSVTVVGESLVDIITDPRKEGETRTHPGGSPLNVAIGCARLGMQTSIVTRYGDDAHGDLIHEHLTSNNVNVINGGTAPTSVALATLDEQGAAHYSFNIRWDLNGASLPALAAVERGRHVHTGSLATVLLPGREAAYSLVKAARKHATISYDPNCRPAITPDRMDAQRQAERFVALSDIVKASDEDLRWLYPDMTPEEAAQLWLRMGPALIAVTRGADGPWIATRRSTVQIPAEAIEVADTVGAGDSFMAGLISRLDTISLLGTQAREELAEISTDALMDLAAYANRAAAITCSRTGAEPPWASEIELLSR